MPAVILKITPFDDHHFFCMTVYFTVSANQGTDESPMGK
jgi:hypothetical protein